MNKIPLALIGVIIISSVLISNFEADAKSYQIPSWLKNNAKWWSQGQVSDEDFVNGVQYLLRTGVMQVPLPEQFVTTDSKIPTWVKDNSGLWAIGQASNDQFVNGIQYLLQDKILTVPQLSQNTGTQDTKNLSNKTNMVTSGSQTILSYQDLVAMAGNKYSDGTVPIGDGKYLTSGPQKGYVYLCSTPPSGQGAQGNGPWIHGNTWNFLEKLSVSGSVSWPNAVFSNSVSQDTRTLSGNDLPTGHTTGNFPISSSDPVAKYDMNPNSISAQSFSDKLPASPKYSDTPYCIRGEVGIMLSGIPLFDAFDAELRDAPAHEAQDSCSGHPQKSGEYHYHSLSSCFKDINETTVLGYALDGFPITGPRITNDKYLTTDNLDECHGITSEISENGVSKMTYHYVMTYDFPYSVSCFRGAPAQFMVIPNSESVQAGQNTSGPNQGAPNVPRQPPQESVNTCGGKSNGSPCLFKSPMGDVISGTCHITPSNLLACVPNR